MIKINRLISALFVTALIIIYGCGSDSPTTTTTTSTITVTGKTVDVFGAPLSTGLEVVIGTQITNPGADGSFTISNVKTPYDIYVLNSAQTLAIGVQGLTIPNPFIQATYFGTLFPRLKVTIPSPPPAGTDLVAIYSDTLTGVVSGYNTFGPASASTNIALGGDGTVTSGRVTLLQYSENGNTITAYTKYARKNTTFTISPSSNTEIIFGNSDFTNLPPSSTVTGSLNVPSNYVGIQSQLRINFGSKNSLSNFGGLMGSTNGNSFSYVVPTGIDTSLKINIVASTTTPYSQKMVTVTAGSNTVINTDSVPTLLTPNNGSIDIDTNTVFTYTNGNTNGIHYLIFGQNPAGKTFIVYTKSTSVKIPNLAVYGYPLGSSLPYQWGDAKISDLNNINDLFSQFFGANNNLRSVDRSILFQFTTKP